MNFISHAKSHLFNLPGWRTNRKIVVFESDDWGSIRMADKQSFEGLKKAGIRVDRSKYDTLDSLEKKEDLEALFNILKGGYLDSQGRPPKFTFNTVMGNPDFEKIRDDNFTSFFHQSFFDSYRQYYGQNLEPFWMSAIQEGLVQPQFHAREHLNTELWMRDLRAGHPETLLAFNFQFFGLKTITSSPLQRHYLMAYHADSFAELAEMTEIVGAGLTLFKQIFSFSSCSFIGCNYVWPKELECVLKKEGIDFLQGQRGHVAPLPGKNKRKIYYHYTGQKNAFGQSYLVRNVVFEPYLDQLADSVGRALKEMEIAFLWGKPSIVSTHRINYVSNLDLHHRDASLAKLDYLLKQITKRWPEVEFMSTDELGKLITADDRNT